MIIKVATISQTTWSFAFQRHLIVKVFTNVSEASCTCRKYKHHNKQELNVQYVIGCRADTGGINTQSQIGFVFSVCFLRLLCLLSIRLYPSDLIKKDGCTVIILLTLSDRLSSKRIHDITMTNVPFETTVVLPRCIEQENKTLEPLKNKLRNKFRVVALVVMTHCTTTEMKAAVDTRRPHNEAILFYFFVKVKSSQTPASEKDSDWKQLRIKENKTNTRLMHDCVIVAWGYEIWSWSNSLKHLRAFNSHTLRQDFTSLQSVNHFIYKCEVNGRDLLLHAPNPPTERVAYLRGERRRWQEDDVPELIQIQLLLWSFSGFISTSELTTLPLL